MNSTASSSSILPAAVKPGASMIDRFELDAALDRIAGLIETTASTAYLPIFERLERELDALTDRDNVLARARMRQKRAA